MNDSEIKNIIDTINDSIAHHEKMKSAFLYSPPSNASGRRSYEKYHSRDEYFTYKGIEYNYWSDCTCSCRHIYYKDGFIVDGEKKDVRAFKKVLKELTEKDDSDD